MNVWEEKTPYELLGGKETIYRLVNAFYPRVIQDTDLSPLFQYGIQEIMRKQKMFLTQFLGGPPLYSMEFGPPAMRRRHFPFEITPKRAKAWLRCMHEAMDEIQLEGQYRDLFYDRLTHLAQIMINAEDEAEG